MARPQLGSDGRHTDSNEGIPAQKSEARAARFDAFHHRGDTVPADSAVSVITIVYGGRRFVVTAEMAGIFLRHAREVIERGEAQLVPLRHVRGVELLLVSRLTPYSLGDVDPSIS